MASGSDTEYERKPTFLDEISQMMHGFGDCANPNFDTVVLVENIVVKQLRSLVLEAKQVAVERGEKNITNYELIYILHRNRNVLKLKRIHDIQKHQEQFEEIEDFISIQELFGDGDVFVEKENIEWRQKRKRTHIKIIRELDGIKEVEKVNHDYLGHIRKLRAVKVTESMPEDQYEAYQQARCVTFQSNKKYNRDLRKLRCWIDPKREYVIKSSALEVLAAIAFEFVTDIVEAVFLTRQDKLVGHSSGFSLIRSGKWMSIGHAITEDEVNEAVSKYLTKDLSLNGLFFKKMGFAYLAESFHCV